MEQVKKTKERTAITIDPYLWERAKTVCAKRAEQIGKKFSFSALVEEALLEYLEE
jgi:hypothetical protein